MPLQDDSINTQRIIDARADIHNAKVADEALTTEASVERTEMAGFPFIDTEGNERMAVDKYVDTRGRVVLKEENDHEWMLDPVTQLYAEIQIEGQEEDVKASLSLTFGDGVLIFEAQLGGVLGNDITVEVVDGEDEDGDLAVAVVESAITITLGTDEAGDPDDAKNTIELVVEAVNASEDAAALVEASSTGDDSNVVTVTAATNLEDGEEG